MKEIMDAISKLGVSEPIFVMDQPQDDDATRLTFRVKNPYIPTIASDDVISALVVNSYGESFDKHSLCFRTRCDADIVFRQIINLVAKVYDLYAPYRNPRATKTYKWLSDVQCRYNYPLADGFIALYKYIFTYKANNGLRPHDVRFVDGKENPHVKNIIAIIELMKEKYEK